MFPSSRQRRCVRASLGVGAWCPWLSHDLWRWPAVRGRCRRWILVGCEMATSHLFVGCECSLSQCHFSSWPIWAVKIFPRPHRDWKGKTGRKQCLWPKTKHIPCCVPTKVGSRPLNQKHCLEGAPIKQILKACFIHNASWCYFVPTWNWFPASHFTAVFGSLYSAFCCSALWCFWLFEIRLNPAVNLTEPFILPLFHWCDMWPNILYQRISVMSLCDTLQGIKRASEQSKTYYDR